MIDESRLIELEDHAKMTTRDMISFYAKTFNWELVNDGVQVGPRSVHGGREIPTIRMHRDRGYKAQQALADIEKLAEKATKDS